MMQPFVKTVRIKNIILYYLKDSVSIRCLITLLSTMVIVSINASSSKESRYLLREDPTTKSYTYSIKSKITTSTNKGLQYFIKLV